MKQAADWVMVGLGPREGEEEGSLVMEGRVQQEERGEESWGFQGSVDL